MSRSMERNTRTKGREKRGPGLVVEDQGLEEIAGHETEGQDLGIVIEDQEKETLRMKLKK